MNIYIEYLMKLLNVFDLLFNIIIFFQNVAKKKKERKENEKKCMKIVFWIEKKLYLRI